jgi:hypothetical protein
VPVRTLIGLSGFAVAIPLLAAWVKVRLWELRERRELP